MMQQVILSLRVHYVEVICAFRHIFQLKEDGAREEWPDRLGTLYFILSFRKEKEIKESNPPYHFQRFYPNSISKNSNSLLTFFLKPKFHGLKYVIFNPDVVLITLFLVRELLQILTDWTESQILFVLAFASPHQPLNPSLASVGDSLKSCQESGTNNKI